ncbi:PH domain-containing protein [Humibacter ginsenosidimutans]|uniref:PH domain-containing protein n=1 Tax=Humibacter ginsenosidimutans TaxID=2599293 RepID=A0A5B8M6C0_9MICO|nr:PH domain-containing protein [Humibacter ginsenosidimutans]QDZ15132.1 PH domain-containing protein [Humibacter ginsenosidimutans]
MTQSYTTATGLADGEWHRMHKATPLLRGGIAIVAVVGVIVANLRERIVAFFLNTPDYPSGDPVDVIVRHNFVWPAIGIAAAVIAVCVGVFALSWRVQTFRVTHQAVELRSGILRRQERKARLDRIQGINVQRPVFARLFGAAKLEIVVAGHDANVHLAYLPSKVTETLRREILRLASGVRAEEAAEAAASSPLSELGERRPEPVEGPKGVAPGQPFDSASPRSGSGRVGDLLLDRANEFISPADLDPDAAPPASVVRMHPGRLAGSLLLSGPSLVMFAIVIAMIAGASTGRLWLIIVIFPTVLSLGGLYIRRFSKAVRYNIAGSDAGVRIGFGLLTTSSETIPPQRIHAVELLQPVAWRPFGWWQMRMNTAGHTHGKNSAGEARTTTLPVGSVRDVQRVLPLLLPGMDDAVRDAIAHAGMVARADQSAFSSAPRRAAWLRPFSWRKTGYTIADGVVVFRHGALWRRVMFVPLARLQSVEVEQGPARRILGLASADAHLVDGPVHAKLPVADVRAAQELFALVSSGAIAWAEVEHGAHPLPGSAQSSDPRPERAQQVDAPLSGTPSPDGEDA